jgi:site-specific DNA recombinase
MKVALFARYSSKMQDEMSLGAQISEMESFCEGKSWTITHRYLLPETSSADVAKAPQFIEMLDAGKRREFQVLLIHKLDRFGRDRETAVVNKALLRRCGVKVHSAV